MADTPITNTHQYEAWNGYEGWHWADHQARYDALNDELNAPLLDAAALRDTDTVLDIGCGNGSVTRLAARRARHAVGIDLSAPMLERARTTAETEGLHNVTHVQGDAQVHPFEPSAFDVALSRYGVMFFADPVAAFGNIAGALREGGRLAFVCPQSFDRLDQARIFEAVAQYAPLPDLTAASATGPASFADPSRTREVLSAAGFEGIDVTPWRPTSTGARTLPTRRRSSSAGARCGTGCGTRRLRRSPARGRRQPRHSWRTRRRWGCD